MLSRRHAIILSAVGLLALSLAVSATAMAVESSSASVAAQPSAGGVLALTGDQASPLSVYVGGGIWNYGTRIEPWGTTHRKVVWSHYWHPGKYHSATAKIADSVKKVYACAGAWAKASTWSCAYWKTGYAYWNTY